MAAPTVTRARVGLGRAGERLAAQYLATLGYEIVARNYRCSLGELDLVTRKDGAWVFVEVRTRRGAAYGTPEESVTQRKRAHLLAAAQTYLHQSNLVDVAWRVDFVAVALSSSGELLRVNVIENAVRG